VWFASFPIGENENPYDCNFSTKKGVVMLCRQSNFFSDHFRTIFLLFFSLTIKIIKTPPRFSCLRRVTLYVDPGIRTSIDSDKVKITFCHGDIARVTTALFGVFGYYYYYKSVSALFWNIFLLLMKHALLDLFYVSKIHKHATTINDR